MFVSIIARIILSHSLSFSLILWQYYVICIYVNVANEFSSSFFKDIRSIFIFAKFVYHYFRGSVTHLPYLYTLMEAGQAI